MQSQMLRLMTSWGDIMAEYLDKEGLSYFWGKIDTEKQDTLVSGENIKTINNESILGSGNIDIQGGGGDVADVEVDGVSVVDQDGVAEIDLTGKQDTLVSGTNIKTVNNNSLLGSGNLDIVGGVSDVEVDGTSVVNDGVAEIDLTGKQDSLVSGTNIKTVNNNSLLGSGNVAVQDVLVSGTNIKTINSNSILGSGDMVILGTDVTAVYQKHESYYVTVGSSESTIAINVDGYRSTDILLVDINGLDLVLGEDYTISGTNIILDTPITHAGTVVHFTALRAGAVNSQDLSALKGDKGDTGDAGVVQDVLVDGTSVLTGNVAEIDLTGITKVLNTYGVLTTLSSSLSLTTSAQKVPLNTFTGSNCSKSSNGIKVTDAGEYMVSGSAYFQSGFTANDLAHLQIRVGSTTVIESVKRLSNASPYEIVVVPATIVTLSANDVVYLYAYNQSGARGTVASYTGNGLVLNRIA